MYQIFYIKSKNKHLMVSNIKYSKWFPKSVNKPIPCALDVAVPDLDVKFRIPLYDNNNNKDEINENNEGNKGSILLNIK